MGCMLSTDRSPGWGCTYGFMARIHGEASVNHFVGYAY
jgi:hypothetical protein